MERKIERVDGVEGAPEVMGIRKRDDSYKWCKIVMKDGKIEMNDN